jgi:TatD DNase family protein
LAIKHDLPIVIHCREAFNEIFEILDKENCDKLRGVFHCFTGTFEEAQRAIDLGFVLGIGGVVTFKNGGIDKFLHKIDLKNIVLETDSPYLAPVHLEEKEMNLLHNICSRKTFRNLWNLKRKNCRDYIKKCGKSI